MSGNSEEHGLLAAEYVLGVLQRGEARAIEEMAQVDPALAAAITEWQDRLAPLARLVAPMALPPELWSRLEDAIAPVVVKMPAAQQRPLVRAWRSPGFWRGSTAAALAMAAAFAGIAFIHNPPNPSSRVMFLAELAPTDTASRSSSAPLAQAAAGATETPGRGRPLAQVAADDGGSAAERLQQATATPVQTGAAASGSTLERAASPEAAANQPGSAASAERAASPAQPVGFVVAGMPDGWVFAKPIGSVSVPAGKEMQLWEQPPGVPHPRPLGTLPPSGGRLHVAGGIEPNTRLIVSLEPRGAAAGIEPSGPVLFSGTLAHLD